MVGLYIMSLTFNPNEEIKEKIEKLAKVVRREYVVSYYKVSKILGLNRDIRGGFIRSLYFINNDRVHMVLDGYVDDTLKIAKFLYDNSKDFEYTVSDYRILVSEITTNQDESIFDTRKYSIAIYFNKDLDFNKVSKLPCWVQILYSRYYNDKTYDIIISFNTKQELDAYLHEIGYDVTKLGYEGFYSKDVICKILVFQSKDFESYYNDNLILFDIEVDNEALDLTLRYEGECLDEC